MAFTLPPLPYALGALAPFLGEEQMTYHYTKHHNAYVVKLNGLLEGKPEANAPLRELIATAAGPVYNNAAQIWNHSFFWSCMVPGGTGEPTGDLLKAITHDFGSVEAFKKDFAAAAVNLFGSGWAWLAAGPDGKLEIMQGSNADNPIKHGKEPVLTIDVWEHAYYVDYRNERPRFVEGFWSVVNWESAAKAYAGGNK